MRERSDLIEGTHIVDEDLICLGVITNHDTVTEGSMLNLKGMATGDLEVEQGGRALIHGMVTGTVINRGGYVEVFGHVVACLNRSLSLKPSCTETLL